MHQPGAPELSSSKKFLTLDLLSPGPIASLRCRLGCVVRFAQALIIRVVVSPARPQRRDVIHLIGDGHVAFCLAHATERVSA